ncbi:hypothetical protein DFJ74DRAFT_770494, partial [Hyaloraphidium curvatum]
GTRFPLPAALRPHAPAQADPAAEGGPRHRRRIRLRRRGRRQGQGQGRREGEGRGRRGRGREGEGRRRRGCRRGEWQGRREGQGRLSVDVARREGFFEEVGDDSVRIRVRDATGDLPFDA